MIKDKISFRRSQQVILYQSRVVGPVSSYRAQKKKTASSKRDLNSGQLHCNGGKLNCIVCTETVIKYIVCKHRTRSSNKNLVLWMQ